MSEYLSKEEIKQWRSSLEKITLEEFAARLGKKIEEAKPTNDLVDIIFKGHPTINEDENQNTIRTQVERISAIAERAYERELEIAPSMFSLSKLKLKTDEEIVSEKKETISAKKETAVKSVKKVAEKVKAKVKSAVKKTKVEKIKPVTKAKVAKKTKIASVEDLREEVRVVFKKALTDREQKVFDHFAKNRNKVVYAKDLASLLELPRDYVYKYIKNLRSKIDGDKLENADKGGFILHV